jgi:hypothetical protein
MKHLRSDCGEELGLQKYARPLSIGELLANVATTNLVWV